MKEKPRLSRDHRKRHLFDELYLYYKSYNRDILAYLRYFSGNDDDALDALQETYCRALEYIERGGSTIENPRAWLLKIARNEILHKQNRSRQEIRLWRKSFECEAKTENFTLQLLDKLLTESISEYIRDEFSQNMQEIFILRYFHEMNLAEIAMVTETPLTTVHRLLERISEKVQSRFERSSG